MTAVHWLLLLAVYAQQQYDYSKKKNARRSDVLWNVLFVGPFCAFLAVTLGPARYSMQDWNAEIIAVSIPVFVVMHDALFWSLHWSMHHVDGLWEIHKQHHSLGALDDGDFAFAANPIEHALLNCGTFMLPLVLLCVPTEVFFVACLLAVRSAMLAHGDPEGRHSKHHSLRNVNYGNLWLMDMLCGTEYTEA